MRHPSSFKSLFPKATLKFQIYDGARRRPCVTLCFEYPGVHVSPYPVDPLGVHVSPQLFEHPVFHVSPYFFESPGVHVSPYFFETTGSMCRFFPSTFKNIWLRCIRKGNQTLFRVGELSVGKSYVRKGLRRPPPSKKSGKIQIGS